MSHDKDKESYREHSSSYLNFIDLIHHKKIIISSHNVNINLTAFNMMQHQTQRGCFLNILLTRCLFTKYFFSIYKSLTF